MSYIETATDKNQFLSGATAGMGLQATLTQSFYLHFVSGIIESGIPSDGGVQCYEELSKPFLLTCSAISIVIYGFLISKFHRQMDQMGLKIARSSNFEKFIAFASLLSLLLTFYYKIVTRKGLFIFNPCHVTLLIMIVLLLAPSSRKMRKLHTYWTAWLYGAYMALLLPHLDGLSTFEVFLLYYEHLLIVPIGPIILHNRYGFLRPNLRNQLAAFGSFVIYQLVVLMPWSQLTMVNLNFVLCHSHTDPIYKSYQDYYFPAAMVHLCFISLAGRWVSYLLTSGLIRVWDLVNPDLLQNTC